MTQKNRRENIHEELARAESAIAATELAEKIRSHLQESGK